MHATSIYGAGNRNNLPFLVWRVCDFLFCDFVTRSAELRQAASGRLPAILIDWKSRTQDMDRLDGGRSQDPWDAVFTKPPIHLPDTAGLAPGPGPT